MTTDPESGVERASECCEAVLTVYALERYLEWVDARLSLGEDYVDRIRGERSENIESAIAHCGMVLTVCVSERLPIRYAETQSDLGSACGNHVQGRRVGDNLIKVRNRF